MQASYLLEKLPEVIGVLSQTANHFGLGYGLPDDFEAECSKFLEQAKKKVLIFRLPELIFLKFSVARDLTINVELTAPQEKSSEITAWEKSLKAVDLKGFDFSESFNPSVPKTFIEFKVKPKEAEPEPTQEDEVTEEIVQEIEKPEPEPVTEEQDVDEPEPLPVQEPEAEAKKEPTGELVQCAHCKHLLSEQEIKRKICSECEQIIHLCPHCNKVLKILGEGGENSICPLCKKSLVKVECDVCPEKFYADLGKCPNCNTHYGTDRCPHCKKFVTKLQKNKKCPHCSKDIYVCLRCSKLVNPIKSKDSYDRITWHSACPNCNGSWTKVSCNKCGEELFSDEKRCEKCGEQFVFEKCPNCSKTILSGLKKCPKCGNSLSSSTCVHCEKRHYIHR